MTASRKSCALLLVVVMGMLTRAEALPGWIENIVARIKSCGSQARAAANKMWDSYQDMRNANWRNCDKYFHCRGNYEAAQYGSCGRRVAIAISNAREWTDLFKNFLRTFNSGTADGAADQAANAYGRDGGDCVQRYIRDTRGTSRECSLPSHLW